MSSIAAALRNNSRSGESAFEPGLPKATSLAQCRPVHSTLLMTITTLVSLVAKANRAAFLAMLLGAYDIILGARLP